MIHLAGTILAGAFLLCVAGWTIILACGILQSLWSAGRSCRDSYNPPKTAPKAQDGISARDRAMLKR